MIDNIIDNKTEKTHKLRWLAHSTQETTVY